MSKQSELDEILSRHGAEAGEMTHSLKQALLDWHYKQVEEVLNRLLNGTTTMHLDTQPNNLVKGNIEPMLLKAEIKAAIEAERNKLKEGL